MAGVIDNNNVQWEHCNECAKYVRLTDLGYEKPSAQHKHGRDLCAQCVDTNIRIGAIKFNQITPATSWVTYEVAA